MLLTDEIKVVFILTGLTIFYGIYSLIRYRICLRKSREGTRYQELQVIVARALRKETACPVVYGHREEAKYEGKHVSGIYYHYALAFCGNCLWIAPLSFEKKTNAMFLSGRMVRIGLDELGKVIVFSSGKKDLLDLVLYCKDGSPSVNCRIEGNNIRNPVNICQPEACQALCEQMELWANQVNPANGELPVPCSDDKKKRIFLLITLGIVGVAVGGLFGPMGLVLGLFGLSIAILVMQGEQKPNPIISANKILPPPWSDEKKKRTTSLILKLGVTGIAVGWCIGPLGIVFGWVGLMKAISARKMGMTSVYVSHVWVNVLAIMIGFFNILLLLNLLLLWSKG